MAVDQIRQIDQDNNNQINMQELLDAMQPNGFLSKEENIQAVWDLLNNWNLNWLDVNSEFLSSLEQWLYDLKEYVMWKERITAEDRNVLLVYKKLLWEKCGEVIRELDEFIRLQDELDRQDEINNSIENSCNILDPEPKWFLEEILVGEWSNRIEKIDKYLEWNINLSKESYIKWINILNTVLKVDNKKHEILERKVDEYVFQISHDVNKRIAERETWNSNRYTKTEIMAIQLWANVCYWENLTINWDRWKDVYRAVKDFSSETSITSSYIYRLEISTRSDVIEIRHNNRDTRVDYLLDIPNLYWMLSVIEPKEKQDEIWQNFLNTIFLPVRQWWLYFENKITWERMEKILQNMIYAEIYKDTPVSEEIMRLTQIKDSVGVNSPQYQQCENIIAELWKYSTLWEYYTQKVKQGKEQINIDDRNNRDANEVQLVNNALKPIINQINSLPKLKDNPTETEIQQYNNNYKKAYKKIADDFVSLWRNQKYRKYLENNILTTQIFIEMYSLRNKEWIDKVFWNDIKESIYKVVNQLYSFSDAENDGFEHTVDLYYSTMDAEHRIEQWRSERWESHDTHTNTRFEYYPAVDNTATPYYSWHPAWYTTITETIHSDTYFGNWYNENYNTTVWLVESSSPWNPQGTRIDVPEDHDPNATLVWPNKDWWYAILSPELKEKSNKWQIKLAIIMWKPCVYEFTPNWDIKFRIYDKVKKKLVFDKIMTQAEYLRAITIEGSRMKVWEAEHWEEFKNIQTEMKDIMDKNKAVNDLFAERENKDLDGNEADLLRKWSIKLYNMIKDFATPQMRAKLKKLMWDLQRLNQNSNSYENPYERQITEYIKNINSILWFATDEQVKSAKQFMEFCTNTANVHENDDWYDKTRQEWVAIAVSFVVAVAAVIVSIGTFWLWAPLAAWWAAAVWAALWVWAISTGTAMITRELTQIWLNKRTWWWHITVDGVEYELDYNNPTLIEQALDPNSPVTFRDCVKWYWTEFITWTILQAALMWWWARASQLISQIIAKSPSWSFARKSSEFICKILCRDRNISDSYTEGLINSVERQVWKEWFMKNFSHELLEETFEESVEQAAQNIWTKTQWTILWAIATLVHCLKPRPWQALQLAWVWKPKLSIPEGQKKVIAENTYDWSNPDNLTILKNYYEGLPWYTVTQEEWWILRVVAHWVSDWNVSIIDAWKTIEMEFRPSNAPLYIRWLSEDLLSMWGIQIDEQTWNVTYRSKSNLMALATYFRHNNLWNIKINKDGTAQIITSTETITLTQSSDYSENSIFDINTRRFEIIWLSEEIWDLDTKIQSINDEISQLSEWDPYKKELEKQKSELEDQRTKSKKRKASLESAIEIVEQRTTKYDPEILDRQIAEKKEKLNNMDKNSKDYKNLEKEIKNLENKKESWVYEIFQNWELLLQKSTFREKLTLKLKKLKCELKRLYYNATQNWQKIAEIKNEINNIEREIRALDLEIADIIKSTYSGLRNLKWLEDSELMELTHTYYENILKPMQFAIINPSQTFDSGVVSCDFSTQREVSIEWTRENPNKFATVREKIKWMRLGNYAWMKSISDISTFINENFEEWSSEKQILLNLKKSLQENVGLDDTRLSEEDRAVIFLNWVSYMLDYTEAYPEKTWAELYEILDINQNKLIHQHIQDKHFLTWSSHDVLHILRWNMNMAENFMENMSPKERVLTRQIIIDHDMWYTSAFNHLLSWIRSDVFFDATKDHPLRSSQFVEDNMSWYQNQFGDDGYQIIRNSITWHSKPDTVNLPTSVGTDNTIRWKQINAVISVVDCVAASADYKSAFLFWQPEMAWEFMSVYTAMNAWNINEAIEWLHKIVDTVNTIKDPQLKSAITDALNSLHLIDPTTWEITLDNKINEINEMTESDIDKARKKIVANLKDPDKSKKTLWIFCKANWIADPSTVTENTITSEQVKNYLKFDYINDRVSFPYEKYLSQYWVRVSIDAEWKTMIWVNEKWVVEATFELAWSSFETLLNTWRDNYDFKWKTVADFALASFLKVCDDMNIELKWWDIWTLKQHVNNRVKDNEGKTLSQYLSSKYNQNYVEFKWRKWEKIVLNFDWKSYEWFDQIMEFESKIDKLLRSENKYEAIENIRELFDSYTRISESVWNVYMVNQQELASYLKDIQTRLNTISDSDMWTFIEEIASNMKKWYFTMSDNFITQN